MKVGKGAILGLVGGLLGLVSVFLPWFTVGAAGISVGFSGLQLASPTIDVFGVQVPNPYSGTFSMAVYGTLVFSLIGMIVVMVPKKATAILGLVCGVLAVVLAGYGFSQASALASTVPPTPGLSVGPGFGIYLGIIGGLLLLIGGALALMDVRKAGAPMATPPPMAPMQPPPM